MKKIVALILGLAIHSSYAMENNTHVVPSPARVNNGDFALVPHEIIKAKIIIYFANLKRRPFEHARTFHALCKSNKYFSEFLKDPKINETMIKAMASHKNKKKKWVPICKEKLLFSAAFQLNTVGARLYIKTFGQPNSWDFAIPVLSTVIAYPKSDRICRFGLRCGIDPNYVWWGPSALQNAAATNRRKCVLELLSHGADPNYFIEKKYLGPWGVIPTPQYLPLRLALIHNSTHRIISLLLLHGANPNLVDTSGKSPLECARKGRLNAKRLQLIEEYAKRFNTVEK